MKLKTKKQQYVKFTQNVKCYNDNSVISNIVRCNNTCGIKVEERKEKTNCNKKHTYLKSDIINKLFHTKILRKTNRLLQESS